MTNSRAILSIILLYVFGSSAITFAADAAIEGSADKPPATARIQAGIVTPDPSTAALTTALRAAKRAGDEARGRSLCEDLGWAGSPVPAPATAAAAPHDVYRAERAGRGGFPGGDVLINDPDWTSNNSAMASTSDGILYIVVDDVRPGANYLDIYRSEDDGYSWNYEVSINGAHDLTNPSIAIGEGNADRLLIAYESGRGTGDAAIYVRFDDLDIGTANQILVDSSTAGVFDPQICVDSPEYGYWYPYLVYTKGVFSKQDRYDLVFTRSLDYGDTWQVPRILVEGVAGGSAPDIDYGESNLYIAYTKYVISYQDDICLLRSQDLGISWDPELLLAHNAQDETDPRVAATNGGGAVVVAFTRAYSPTNTDIEAFVSQDAGDSWDLSYLPWTSYLEAKVDLVTSPEEGRIHAVFWSEHDIHYTWATWDAPSIWVPIETLNEQTSAAVGVRPTVTADPTKTGEACVAWTDTRVEFQYHVYFNAAYPLGDYLFLVAHGGLFPAVAPLAEWKEQLGYNVSVVDLAAVYAAYPTGDDAERIWNYLHDRHASLKYVMLVGDIDLLPIRILYPDGNPAYPPTHSLHHNGYGYGTDYYYAEHSMTAWDLDGDNRWGEFTDDAFDYTPELLIGRLPFNDAEPVQAICSNIVTFEQDTGAWKRNALLAHGFLSQPAGPTTSGPDCASGADYMRANLMQPYGWTTTTLFEQVGLGQSAYSSTDGLSQANYEGYCGLQTFGVVNCAAHGNGESFGAIRWLSDMNGSGYCDLEEEWAWNDFSLRDRIPPHPAQSVVFLNGCLSAPIVGEDSAFEASPLRSRYLIRNPRENLAFKTYLLTGAVGLIGSSAGSVGSPVWNSPADGNSLSLNYYFYDHLIADSLPVGDAFHRAQHSYALNHGLQRPIRVFNYYGDPSLVLPGIATTKRGGTLAADPSLPGHLAPDAALALAVDWQRSVHAASPAADPPVTLTGSRDEADIWTPCADLPDCMTVTSLLRTPVGDVFGTGIAALGTEGTKGLIFASGNGWDPWAVAEIEGLRSARVIFRTRLGTLLVGGLWEGQPGVYEGIVLRTEDYGQNWTAPVVIPDGLVTDICQDQAGTLWLTSGLNGQIWRSEDDGASWTIQLEFSGEPYLNSIMQASNGRYFATMLFAGYLSVIESDNAYNWYPVGGLGAVESGFDVVEVDGRLYAGVAEIGGGRVYHSDDLLGETWSPLVAFPAGAGAQAVRSLAVDYDGRIVAGLSVDQSSNATRVYTMDLSALVWVPYGGIVDVADRVTAILPVSGATYIGTGSFHGNIYRCAGPIATDAPDGGQTPRYKFMLSQNYPNPFNPSTTIAYELPAASPVTIGIYDVMGNLVRLLVAEAGKDAGKYLATWDGRDDAGRTVPAGVYFYRLDAGGYRETRRMVLVK